MNDKLQVSELPVLWQSVVVDVESVAPLMQFSQDSYDVANMTAVVAVQVPEQKKYRLLLSSDVESGTRATVRVVSSDEQFDTVESFVKLGKQEAVDYLPQLDKSGLVDPSLPEKDKVKYIQANFKEATILVPMGVQKLRIHASKKLVPATAGGREYSLVQYAPLLGFTTGGGQVNLSLAVTFPPAFEGNAMTIDAPSVDPIPGQPAPSDAVAPFDGTIGAVRAFAWHWRTDPKVTLKYRYQ